MRCRKLRKSFCNFSALSPEKAQTCKVFVDRGRKWETHLGPTMKTCKVGARWTALTTLHSVLFSAHRLVHACWCTLVAGNCCSLSLSISPLCYTHTHTLSLSISHTPSFWLTFSEWWWEWYWGHVVSTYAQAIAASNCRRWQLLWAWPGHGLHAGRSSPARRSTPSGGVG